jgi:hypothetical protein
VKHGPVRRLVCQPAMVVSWYRSFECQIEHGRTHVIDYIQWLRRGRIAPDRAFRPRIGFGAIIAIVSIVVLNVCLEPIPAAKNAIEIKCTFVYNMTKQTAAHRGSFFGNSCTP